MRLPKIGEKIYVPTSLYLSHGLDDFAGGIATISGIHTSDFLPPDHINYYMVSINDRPDTRYNWRCLLEDQDKLKERYKDEIAHPDPDDRPEFNMWD